MSAVTRGRPASVTPNAPSPHAPATSAAALNRRRPRGAASPLSAGDVAAYRFRGCRPGALAGAYGVSDGNDEEWVSSRLAHDVFGETRIHVKGRKCLTEQRPDGVIGELEWTNRW